MLKVKIKDPKSGFRMNMPIPYHFFIDVFVRKSMARLCVSSRSIPDNKQLEYARLVIESVDFDELRGALHQIKNYRGLSFVDIEAADGTIVKIINT